MATKATIETAESCPHFETCSAPICTGSESSIRGAAWFPSEEICALREHPEWVDHQRRIARAVGRSFEKGCFSVEMLERSCVVTRGMLGLEEITPEGVRRWLEKHPAKVARAISPELLAARVEGLKKARAARKAQTATQAA